MKKILIFIAFVILTTCFITGCTQKNDEANVVNVTDESTSPTVKPLENAENPSNEPSEDIEVSTDELQEGVEEQAINYLANMDLEDENVQGIISMFADFGIDMASLDGTQPFFQFLDMLIVNPESYLGKTVTVSGEYTGHFDDYENRQYNYVFVMDEMGCCPLMMEFELKDGDYPEESTQIKVTGVFKSYNELDWDFYYLEADSMSILDGGVSQ